MKADKLIVSVTVITTVILCLDLAGQEKVDSSSRENSSLAAPRLEKVPPAIPPDSATAAPKNETQLSPKTDVAEAAILSESAQDGMLSMELASLAREKGAKPSIRNFAERLEKNHQRSQEELVKLLGKKGMTPPKALSEKQREELSRIGKLSGEQLDQAYLEQVLTQHAQIIPQLEGLAKAGSDQEIQSYARMVLPSLREHFRIAQELSPGKVLKEGAGGVSDPATGGKTGSAIEKVNPPSNIDKPNTPDVKHDPAPAPGKATPPNTAAESNIKK